MLSCSLFTGLQQKSDNSELFKRPDVAGAVLQTALSLIQWVSHGLWK